MTLGNSSYTMIDQLTMESLIGRGGMGNIWRATHRDGAKVAVKVLRDELIESTQARELFRREAEIVQQLKSPQVIRMYQYAVTAERIPYMVMELLEGTDLQTYLDEEGPLDLVSAVTITIEILKALSEAHSLGIVHRDIKPSNLFWLNQSAQESQQVKILDFGLATQHNHTASTPKHLVGTYLFMAPEQARREAVSPRSDLYSVSATLYALLTGYPPRRPSSGDQSFDHFEQPAPKLVERAPKLKAPAKLDQLIQRGLAIDPQERPQNADVLRRALEQVLSQLKRHQTSSEIDDLNLAPMLSSGPQPELTFDAKSITSGFQTPVPIPVQTPTQTPVQTPSMAQLNISGEFTSAELAFEGSEDSPLLEVLRGKTEVIAQKWTQAITERPERSGVQTHRLHRHISTHLQMLIGLTSGQSAHQYRVTLEPLTQLSFTHPPLELLPMVTTSLLRKVVRTELEYLKLPMSLLTESLALLDLQIFRLRQLFIEVVARSQLEDSNNSLYRLFSSGSDTPLLCTLSGVAINTHPDLRAALVRDEGLGLTGRKIASILKGFQPITHLFNDLQQLEKTPPSRPYLLTNESASGRAEELVAYPHLIQANQKNLLLIIDVVSERQMTELLPSLDDLNLGAEFASPQALPWQMTSEVQALKPEELSADQHPQLDYLSTHQDSISPKRDHQVHSHSKDEAITQRNQSELQPRQSSLSPSSLTSSSELPNSSPIEPSVRSRPTLQKSNMWDDYHPQNASHQFKTSPSKSEDHYYSEPAPLSRSFGSIPPVINTRSHEASNATASLQYPDSTPLRSAPPIRRSAPPIRMSAPPSQRPNPTPQHSNYSQQHSSPPNYRSNSSPYRSKTPSQYPYQSEIEEHFDYSPHLEVSVYKSSEFPHLAPPRSPDIDGYDVGKPNLDLTQDQTDQQVSVYPEISQIEQTDHSKLPRSKPPRQPQNNYPYNSSPPTAGYLSSSSYRSSSSLQNEESVAPNLAQLEEELAQYGGVNHDTHTNTNMNHHGHSHAYRSHEHPIPHLTQASLNPRMLRSRTTSTPQIATPHPSNQVSITPVPIQNREPVDREVMRVKHRDQQLNERRTWVVNLLIFLIVVLVLLLVKDKFTQWVKSEEVSPPMTSMTSNSWKASSPPNSTHQSQVNTSLKNGDRVVTNSIPPLMNTSDQQSTPIAHQYITVKVNVNKAIFFLKDKDQIVCRQIPFCAIPIGSELVIRSEGYYDRYIQPNELNLHQGQVWEVELEKAPKSEE